MKKLIVLLSFIAFSCVGPDRRVRVGCEYPGGIILQKYEFSKSGLGDDSYDILFKNEVVRFVTPYGIESFSVGDTVKTPCYTN